MVGAGPGAPDLITVRGLECIRKADVVVYDRLVSPALVREAPSHAERIFAGKSRGRHDTEQDLINRILLEHAAVGQRVVRLKGGDPFVFGRGGEEAIFLASRGIPVEIIPGLTSAVAVPGVAGIPLTHRRYASSVAFLAGHRREDGAVPVTRADTLVYLMPVKNLERIVQRIVGSGVFPSTTPCALIENGTHGEERVIAGCLESIVRRARQEVVEPPAVLVVGEVVRLRDRIAMPLGEIEGHLIDLQGYSRHRKSGQDGWSPRTGSWEDSMFHRGAEGLESCHSG